jgi:hypothetical protein
VANTKCLPKNEVSTQPQAATHWLVRDLFKLTAEASASHLSSYKMNKKAFLSMRAKVSGLTIIDEVSGQRQIGKTEVKLMVVAE